MCKLYNYNIMEELRIKIKRTDRKKYDLEVNEINFSELEKKILLTHAREALERSALRAKEAGLDKLSNRDINRIIKTVRKSA